MDSNDSEESNQSEIHNQNLTHSTQIAWGAPHIHTEPREGEQRLTYYKDPHLYTSMHIQMYKGNSEAKLAMLVQVKQDARSFGQE